MEAAERSIPLPMMTRVIPQAMIPCTENWRRMLNRLPVDRKPLEAKLMTTTRRIRISSMVWL